MSAWTPEAQAMFERITSHYKPYDIEPTLKERTLLVSRLTIVATERLDLGALLSARFQWLSTFFVSSENIFKKSLDRGGGGTLSFVYRKSRLPSNTPGNTTKQ